MTGFDVFGSRGLGLFPAISFLSSRLKSQKLNEFQKVYLIDLFLDYLYGFPLENHGNFY